jgi:hypothetical protein
VAAEGVEMSDKVQVWSCGGGTQSCAIAALIVQGKLPKPDYAVMADTGREVGSTWAYARSVLVPHLARVGVELKIVKSSDFATVDLYSGAEGDTLTIPAFSNITGEPSKLPNYCTNEWKTRVIDRALRDWGMREQYLKWIGFSIDEATRVMRMQASQPNARFPLVERMMKRADCVKLVKDSGWPTPPRSRCWMCPNQHDVEWRELKENRPIEFHQAVMLDHKIRETDPHAWLHKSCKPLDQIDFSKPLDAWDEVRACDSGNCFV